MTNPLPTKDTTDFTDPEQISQFLEAIQDKCHLLLPFTEIDTILPMHKVSKRWVKIDPDPAHEEVYCPKQNNPNRVALTSMSLKKLEHAAGLEWLTDQFMRIDDASDPLYCNYKTVAKIRDFDGTWRTSSASRETDLRNESPQLAGLTANDIAEKRRWIQAQSETKSKNRLIREVLGIKPSYHPKELDKPFLALKLVPNPDFSDPDVKRAYISAMSGAVNMLYPSAPQQVISSGEVQRALPEAPIDITATHQTQPPADPGAPTPPPPPGPSFPPPYHDSQEAETKRQKLIESVSALYMKKIGKTRAQFSPNKPPLTELSDADLSQTEAVLVSKPDFNPDSML